MCGTNRVGHLEATLTPFLMSKTRLSLYTFETPDKLAQVAAEQWLELRRQSPQQPHCVALSGGRIARFFYAAIAERAAAAMADLRRVQFFWADERCVPPGHAESNYLLAEENLFKPLGLPRDNIHRLCGEDDPKHAATVASATLHQRVPSNEKGRPVLDMVFLGMGEDGHVASLFPGELTEIQDDPALYRHVVATKSPPNRLTLGYEPIETAKRVWILISGKGKVAALESALAGEGSLPITRVLHKRAGRETRVFTDLAC